MKLLDLCLKPIPCKEKKQPVLGIAAVLLLLVCASPIAILTYQIPAVIVLPAAALLGFLLIRCKVYLFIFRIPLAAHFLSLYAGYLSLQYMKLNETVFGDIGDIIIPLLFFSHFIAFALLTELCMGILLRLFADSAPHRKLLPRIYLVTGVLIFTSTLFLASETFFANCDELLYIYTDFAPHYIVLTFGCSFAFAVFLCCLRERYIHFVTRLFTGLLLCVYCQYMFMNRALPILDAVAQIDWAARRGECILNAAIWILLIAMPFLADILRNKIKRKLPDFRTVTAAALGTIQMITLLILLITGQKVFTGYESEGLDPTEQFVLSPQENVVVLVLDMADQKLFEQAISEDPAAWSFFNDFTYYTNTAMPYDSTYHSIIAMLTHAQTYPKDSIYDWYSEICSAEPSQTFFNRLHDNQYAVHLYGKFIRKDYSVLKGCADNLAFDQAANFEIDTALLYGSINKMLAYRAMPLFLKQFFEPDINDPDATLGNHAVQFLNGCKFQNEDFIGNLNLRLSESNQPYFVMDHINGAYNHAPEEKIPECNQLLKMYLSQMKSLGIYDDALIIITADHGIHSQPENMPIFYIKKPHDSHTEMQYCSAPITLTDIPATILDVMGLSKDGDEAILGRPISQIPEDEARERLVFQRTFFCDSSLIPWTRYSADDYYGAFFGYKYTGTKEDLAKKEAAAPPDILLETDEY